MFQCSLCVGVVKLSLGINPTQHGQMLKEIYTLIANFFESLKDKSIKSEPTNTPFTAFSTHIEKMEPSPLTRGGLLKRDDDQNVLIHYLPFIFSE